MTPLKISDAAKFLNLTRQGIYVAVKSGRLKASKVKHRWFVTAEDLKEYRLTRYDRSLSKKEDGSLMFDRKKGEYSVMGLAKILGVPIQRIYYWIYKDYVKYTKVGATYVLEVWNLDDPPRIDAPYQFGKVKVKVIE